MVVPSVKDKDPVYCIHVLCALCLLIKPNRFFDFIGIFVNFVQALYWLFRLGFIAGN
jgi:hypothetical protein